MRTINLPSIKDDERKDWSMMFMDESHYDTLFEESVAVYKSNGDPLLVFLKGALSQYCCAQAWKELKNYKSATFNRGSASGISSRAYEKKDGSLSKSLAVPKGWDVMSGIAGYFERNARFPYAHACAWNAKNPEKLNNLIPLCEEVDRKFKEHLPTRWKFQNDVMLRTHPDYRIGQTNFTTITINMNFRTACHKDAGDLKGGFGCINVLRDGSFLGGNLVFPDYRVAVDMRTSDLLLFDPHEFHGNTQIVPLTKESKRLSIVYYYREKMQSCLSMKEEFERAKKRAPGTPLWD